VAFVAAKEMRKWVFALLKTEPGMMKTLFSMAFATKSSPSPSGASGKM